MNPHHALMQELATARQAELLREAKADRDSAGVASSQVDSLRKRLAGPAASLVFALRARRAASHTVVLVPSSRRA